MTGVSKGIGGFARIGMREFRELIRKFRELLGILRVVEMTLVFEFLNVILYDVLFFCSTFTIRNWSINLIKMRK